MRELQLHIGYCKSFNIDLSEMQATEELQGTLFPFNVIPQSTISHFSISLHRLHTLRARHRPK